MTEGLAILKLGPFTIYLYGIIMALAILAGISIARYMAGKLGEDRELVWEIAAVAFIFGLVGARFYHVLHLWDFYSKNLGLIAAIWHGGLGIFGAILGGAFGLFLTAAIKKLNFLKWLDIFAPALALGQAIGRWGNFFNQELYGIPTNLPWGLYIAPERRAPQYLNFDYFHPLFLYESILNFINFLLLIALSAKFSHKLKRGDLFLVYLFNYGLVRFFLESLRFDNWKILGMPTAQLISLVLMILTVFLLFYRRIRESRRA